MKLGLVIASHGRPEILQKVLMKLMCQPRIPDEIVISAVTEADVPEFCPGTVNLQTVFGSAGLTSQRNRGMSHLNDTTDLIVFIDDDFIVGDNYFLKLEKIFEHDHSIVAVTGEVIADGASSPGFTFTQGVQLVERYCRQKEPATYMRETRGTYGCNMAFRVESIGSLRFDERLPLYGWQEDLDFCGALRGRGRIVRTNLVWESTSVQSAAKAAGFDLATRKSSTRRIYLAKEICRLDMRFAWQRETSLPISSRVSARKAMSTGAVDCRAT